MILLGVLVLLKIIAVSKASRLQLHYNKDNKLFTEFVAKSNISKLRFEPHILSPTPIPQALLYLAKEVFCQTFMPEPFIREEIVLSDGGTVGLDWDGPIPTDKEPLGDQPLLVLAPGLGGGSQNIYTT